MDICAGICGWPIRSKADTIPKYDFVRDRCFIWKTPLKQIPLKNENAHIVQARRVLPVHGLSTCVVMTMSCDQDERPPVDSRRLCTRGLLSVQATSNGTARAIMVALP